jgi:hypothetical protein
MNFERGKDPRAQMGIGREAYIKGLIREVLLEMKNAEYPSLKSEEDEIKWQMWRRGIEVKKMHTEYTYPEDFIWKFWYMDCNGEEAHILRKIELRRENLKGIL